MIIMLCFDCYDEKSGIIVKRILLFQGNREIHAINHNTNRDMANITIYSTTILWFFTGVSSAMCYSKFSMNKYFL